MKGAWKLLFAAGIVAAGGLIGGKSAHAEQAGGVPARVTGTRVHVRSAPANGRTIVGLVTKNQPVRVYDWKDGWYQIAYPAGAVCWVSSRVLDAAGPVTAAAKQTPVVGTVRSESINVRAAGHLKAVVVWQAARGETLRIVGQVSDWYKVRPPAHARAWIYGRYVAVDEGAIGPAADETTGIDDDATAFARCEARYLRAKSSGADTETLADVIETYRELAAADSTSEAVRAQCERRVDGILATLTPAQKWQLQQRERERLAAKIEQDRRRIEARRAATPPPAFVARGTIHPLAVVRKDGPTHRLKTGDITLYHLESNSVNLEPFVGKRVGILGQIITAPSTWGGQTTEVITVTDVHELR